MSASPPEALPELACVSMMASKSSRVSFKSLVTDAFSWRPKTPGVW